MNLVTAARRAAAADRARARVRFRARGKSRGGGEGGRMGLIHARQGVGGPASSMQGGSHGGMAQQWIPCSDREEDVFAKTPRLNFL